jgi:parallel beta-helix repeat protein
MTLAAFCATNALSALIAQPAGAAVRTVHAGQSIQAAVDAATPGDTIQVDAGTYTGHVTIAKDGITLRGAGYGAGGSSLVPGGPEAQCDSGICVMGRFDEDFHLLRAVRGVHVTGFSVQGFAGSGIVALGDAGSLFDHVLAAKNGNFGITSVFSSGDRYVSNIAYSNDFAGFQIADSPEAHAQLSNNSAYDNRFGIFVLGASIGTVTDNNLHNNCSGLGFFDAGRQGPTKAWVVSGNTVEHNNQQCPGLPEGDPAISGNGIVILGGQHIVLERNVVRSNQRAPGASTSFSGGVVIMTIPDVVPTAPIDDVVVANTIRNNLPADVVYDETGSGVRFVANDCVKSEPNGLCR